MTSDLIHGGALDYMRASYPDAPEPWMDLSTGINPWSYPNTIVSDRALSELPTRTARDACKAAMASAIGAPPETVRLAPGSELLIRLLPDVIKPKRLAILTPTYGDHLSTWRRADADIIETSDPLSFAMDVDAVIISHPNNPDGRCFDPDTLEAARQKLVSRGGFLIVDEAYADLNPAQSLAPHGGLDGLIILRSFGKFFGLAGLRLGAIIAPACVRNAIADRLGVWPISGTALDIGARGYADLTWQTRTRERLAAAAADLSNALDHPGIKTVGGTHLFQLIEVANAHRLFDQLAQAGIYVRRFEGSKTHLRIGLPESAEALARLQVALSLLV